MIRKWEWIREYCRKRGMSESAELADEIDRVLYYLYGDVEVAGWVWFMDYCDAHSVDVDTVEALGLGPEEVARMIVGNSDFDAGCVSTSGCDNPSEKEGMCDSCGFGALAGMCFSDSSSMYYLFCLKFEEELNTRFAVSSQGPMVGLLF